MKKKKGFTLIELLAVIIILAVIALIATPIILNVVDKARDKANFQTVNGILDAGRLYYTESMLDSDKKLKIDNVSNIYQDVSLMNKPEETKLPNGEIYSNKLYVNDKGLIATSVVLDKKCYIKNFDSEVKVSDDLTNCDLGFVGKDEGYPTLSFNYSSSTGNNEWYKEDMWVTINASDSESGISKIKWCASQGNKCEPSIEVLPKADNKTLTHGVSITTESEANYVCTLVIDVVGNTTSDCSKIIKLDKTSPSFSGISDRVINIGGSIDLKEGVTVNDVISGINGEYTLNPSSVDTSIAGTINVEYSASDNTGNTTTITRKVIVDAEAPTVTYTPQGSTINSNGWSKQDFYVKVELADNSGLGIKEGKWCISQSNTCTPNASISGTTLNPQITTESNNNRICIQATDNNNKQSAVICSDAYKLDKTLPTAGTLNMSGTLGSNNWYTSNVTITANNGSDGLSGHSTTTSNISSITSNTSGTIITITTTDLAGNSSTKTQTIKVDKNAPSLTPKAGVFEITQGDSVNTSTYFNSPSYSISGGSMSCNPVNTSGLAVGNQSVTCTVTGNNGLSSNATKIITVKPKGTSLVNLLKQQYNVSNTVGLLKDGENYYYKGNREQVTSNFVWYEGHLWQVIEVNSDNTVTMITQQPITGLNPIAARNEGNIDYKTSDISKWLNNVFYESINDKSKLQLTTFNIGSCHDDTGKVIINNVPYDQYIGLLDANKYIRAQMNPGSSFLDIGSKFLLSNNYYDYVNNEVRYSWAGANNGGIAGTFDTTAIRPVIRISDLLVTRGDGSLTNPFREEGKSTSTSNVKVGEYISVPCSQAPCGTAVYGRWMMRVASKDSDSIKVILNGLYSTSLFNTTQAASIIHENSPIYVPLSKFANSISGTYRYLGDKTFPSGPYIDSYQTVANRTYIGNVGLPVMGEMFSGNDIEVTTKDPKIFTNPSTVENPNMAPFFWTMNYRDNYSDFSTMWTIQNTTFSLVYPNESYFVIGVRPAIFLNLNQNFTKGDGTAENPYWLGN